MNNSAQNTGNGTCLHCNTMRRTTGVHQTTQTGPVSPIPQNINNKTVFLGFSDNGDFDKTSSNSAGLRQVRNRNVINNSIQISKKRNEIIMLSKNVNSWQSAKALNPI